MSCERVGFVFTVQDWMKGAYSAVKEIVEDQSRNIMIFGLKETDKDNINYKVSEVFQELDKKPLFIAEMETLTGLLRSPWKGL